MSYEVKRQDALSKRHAGTAATLEDAQRAMLQAAHREIDLLVCRDKRTICLVASTASALIVDLRFGRVMTTFTFEAVEQPYGPPTVDVDTAELAILDVVKPVPGRRWER